MVINQALHSMSGYVVIRVEGRFLERFLNVCAKRGIHLWDISRLSPTTLRCKISIKGFRMLPEIARKTHCRAKIIDKCGLPIKVRKYRRRKWFLLGIAVFLLLMLSLNLYVWKIEVVGNEKIPTDIILSELEKSGVSVGQFRFRLDEKSLQNELVARIPQLSWLWVNKQGSKIVVQVKERSPAPEIEDKSQVCNLVAVKDGVVHTLNVKDGFNTVAVGDTVQQGQVLVSGVIDFEGVGRRLAHSSGEVLARTWYEKTKAYSLIEKQKTPTGNSVSHWGFSIFGHTFSFGKPVGYENFEEDTKKTDWAIGNTYLGITILRTTYSEVNVEETLLPAEQVAEKGGEELKREIKRMADSRATATKEDVTFQSIDEETIEVTVISEYLENIAKQVPVSPEAIPQPSENPQQPLDSPSN